MKKPEGKSRCLACGRESDGQLLHLDPNSTGVRWTCSDLFCGGSVVLVEEAKTAVSQEVVGA